MCTRVFVYPRVFVFHNNVCVCFNAYNVSLNVCVRTGTGNVCIDSGGWDDSPWRRSLWQVMDFLVDLQNTENIMWEDVSDLSGLNPRETDTKLRSIIPLHLTRSLFLHVVFSSYLLFFHLSYFPSTSQSLPLFSLNIICRSLSILLLFPLSSIHFKSHVSLKDFYLTYHLHLAISANFFTHASVLYLLLLKLSLFLSHLFCASSPWPYFIHLFV